MQKKGAALAIVLLAIVAAALVPVFAAPSSSAEVKETDITVRGTIECASVSAGSSCTFNVTIINNLPAVPGDSLANERRVYISTESHRDVYAETPVEFVTLKGQKYVDLAITLSADKYATTESFDLKFFFKVTSMESADTASYTISYSLPVKIQSPLSSGSAFNKILGVFDNPLPSPFNAPLSTALITFCLWLLIGFIGITIAAPILFRILSKGSKEDNKMSKRSVVKLMFAMIVMYSLEKSLRVYGAPEGIISSVHTWSFMVYIILGAIVIWRMYLVFVHFTVNKVRDDLAEEGLNDTRYSSDLEPLFNLIGKIVITVFALVLIMASFGIDVAAIITSAGLVTLGISYGASSIISQFFNGMVILITCPFKAGDVVQIGGAGGMYRVKKVKVMNTVFENWSNEDIVVMPNNTVATSIITNMTGKGSDIYKIHVVVGVAFNTDLDKAKAIMIDVATNHPFTVKDGSRDMPYTRVLKIGDSSVDIRVTVYVRDFENHGMYEGQIRDGIFKRFMAEGIEMPFPQVDVHMKD